MMTLPIRTANAVITMAQRGTLTRMWDYSPGLVIALATLWCIAAFLVACVMHVHLLERRESSQRNALIPSHATEQKTVNLRKVA